MLIRNLLLLLFVGLTGTLSAQQVIPKLEIKANETYVVSQNNRLLVDTLIMHDKAKIRFVGAEPAYMAVNKAFIGKDCRILTNGANASNRKTGTPGSAGEPGRSIALDVHFEKLGNLIVDARGGSGDKGEAGQGEVRANKLSDADGSYTSLVPLRTARAGGKGGDGGDGGDIHLTYSTAGFIPRFNHKRGSNSITLLHQGGKPGKTEMNGKEGRAGADGQVTLINASTRLD